MKIGPFDTDKEILVVAEIGNNHEGNFTLAEELIKLAAEAGVGAVKFQTIIPDQLVSVTQEERVQQLEKLCLRHENFERLSKIAQQHHVVFLSTPFDIDSVRLLKPLVPAFKIASGDNNFFPLIEAVAKTGKPILLSSGMSSLQEVSKTKDFITQIWQQNEIQQEMAILHCVSSYPTPPSQANLRAIQQLQQLKVTVGYSDHTIGIEAAVLSVALGARVVEKHFTMSKNYSQFRDHQLSADPKEMKDLVQRIQQAAEMLGDGQKRLQEVERENVYRLRRSIVAGRDLLKGEILKMQDISWVRPGDGLPAGCEREIIGKTIKRSIRKGTKILAEDLG